MEYIDIDGTKLPMVGLGTYSQHGKTLCRSLTTSLDAGVNYFDTAFKYHNEKELGDFLKRSNIDDVLLQSKVCEKQLYGSKKWLWLDKETVEKAYRGTCKRLKHNSIDVFLLHSAMKGFEKYYEQLMVLRDHKVVKIIGVCNFGINLLERLKNSVGEYPMFLQAEIHPYHSQKELIAYCQNNNIVVQARSPFAHGDVLCEWSNNELLKQIARFHNRTVAQIILRWIIQQGVLALPRSSNPIHIKENSEVFDFSLNNDQMNIIDGFNQNRSFGYVSTLG